MPAPRSIAIHQQPWEDKLPPVKNKLSLAALEVSRQDIAALIALWIAIHGGDPPPKEVKVDDTAVLIAAALDRHLANTIEGVGSEGPTEARMHKRLKSFGVEPIGNGEYRGEWICFCFRLIYFRVDGTPRNPDEGADAFVICVCFRT